MPFARLIPLLALTPLLALAPEPTPPQSAAASNWSAEAARIRLLAENDAPRAYAEAHRLLATLPADGPATRRARALNLVARAEVYLARTDAAEQHALEAFELARQTNDRDGQAQADLTVALTSINQGRIDRLIESTTRALTALDGASRPDLLGEALLLGIITYQRIGKLEESVTLSTQAMEMAARATDPLALAYAHRCMGITLEYGRQFEKAQVHYQRMREQARIANSTLLEGQALMGLGSVVGRLNDFALSERFTREAIAKFRAVGAPFGVNFGLLALVSIHQQTGRSTENPPLFAEIFSTFAHYPNPIGEWAALLARSRNWQASGERAAARTDANQALTLARQIGTAGYISESLRRLAELAAEDGDFGKAYSLDIEAFTTLTKSTDRTAGTRLSELVERYAQQSHQAEITALENRNALQQAELARRALRHRWVATLLLGSSFMLLGTLYFMGRLRHGNRLLERSNAELWQSRGDLQQQTTILRSILDSMGEAIAVTNRAGELWLVNPAFEKLFEDWWDQWPDWPSADDGPAHGFYKADMTTLYMRHELPLRRALRGERIDGAELYRCNARDGSGRWIRVTARPVLGTDGGINDAVGLFSDVTEVRQAQERLRDSEHKFRTLVENLPNLVIRYDRHCRQLYANPTYRHCAAAVDAELLSLDGAGNWRGSMPRAEYAERVQQVMATGIGSEFTLSWPTQEGAPRVLAMQIIAERDGDNRVIGALAIGHDITNLKEAERHLEESRDMLRALVSQRESRLEEERKHIAREIHDELGQLLTSQRLHISLLRLQLPLDHPALQQIQQIMALTDQTIHVVRHVAATLRPPIMDMGLVSALEWLGQQTTAAGIACQLETPPPDCIDIDDERATAIFRIVQESLTNVARHAHATEVRIALACEGDKCQLEIADNGIGFDERAPRRHGLGLIGMRERGLMLGGAVEITGRPGLGVSIRILFPLNSAAPEILS